MILAMALGAAGAAVGSGCGGSDSGPCNGAIEHDNDATCAPQNPSTPTSPTPKAFMEDCTSDSECETNLCFPFAQKGTKCTRTCTAATAATDCPAPSTGCNGMGVCKAP
jgi:hypothetical protein